MKAALIEKNGGPEVLEWGELPDPRPRADEVLIRVRAITSASSPRPRCWCGYT